MNIAILNFTHIGTLICNLPLIKRIRERYPQAKITLFTCRRNGVINDIISQQYGVRTICLNHDLTGFKRYVSIIQLACKFYKKFDIGFCGLEPRKTDHIALALLCKESFAYCENNWHSKLITHQIPFTKMGYSYLHQSQFCANVAPPSTTISPDEWPVFHLQFNKKLLKHKFVLPENEILIYYSIENNRETSTLSECRLLKIIRALKNSITFNLIINSSKPIPPSLVKKLTLITNTFPVQTKEFSEFLELLSVCDLCLLGDGGTSHIAAALNIPEVVLFGATSTTNWQPLSNKSAILFDQFNVNNIPIDDIVNAILQKIKSAPSP